MNATGNKPTWCCMQEGVVSIQKWEAEGRHKVQVWALSCFDHQLGEKGKVQGALFDG